jgi:hypothetical protein
MSRATWGVRVPASHKGSLAPALIACFALLAGCAHPPMGTPQSAERPLAERASSTVGPTTSAEFTPPPGRTESSTTEGEPTITFEKTLHDFGEIGAQSTNVCEFRFRNTGTATLKVREKIESSCGCTVPVLAKTEYAPGEEGVIQVTYSAPTSAGVVAKSIVLHSNDKRNNGQVHLSIKATVVERVAYEPRRLRLRLKGPDAGCPPITIRSLDHRSFAVTRIVSSGGGITADFDPDAEGTEFTFQPTLDRARLERYPAGSLVLTLTHPECKVVRILYQALPEFQLSPPSLLLFNAEPNRPVQRDVWLSSNYGEDFEIASCTSKMNLTEVVKKEKVVSADKTSFRYRLRLSIKPPAPLRTQRALGDTLTIHLANGSEVELPCHVFYGTARRSPPGVKVSGH